ncbi:hypothetical protein RB195_024006 [Necator americanus]|uniref:Reverse transcriptase domain-containing protein n=1 Tax=Necator americanus TaxID=51031 RepID=A0ABR1ELH1_NECAM
MPLCLTFIDLKRAFDSVETDAVMGALDNQGVTTQYIKGDTISPKTFTATLEDAMRKLECDAMGVKLKLQKTIFTRNAWVSDAPFTFNGTNISECTSYVYLGRELNMMNDLTPELERRKRAACGADKNIEDVVKKTKNTRLRAHLFNTTVLPALTNASETWAFHKQEENAVFGCASPRSIKNKDNIAVIGQDTVDRADVRVIDLSKSVSNSRMTSKARDLEVLAK